MTTKKPIKKVTAGTVVQNCNFVGVQYDAKAIETISLIATGLIKNAEGLSKLAEVLRASNVTVEALLYLEGLK